MEKIYFFYVTIALCFILDFFCFAFFEQQLLFFTLALFLLDTCRTPKIHASHLLMSLFLLSLQSFFYCGRFGLQLFYLIPTTIIGIKAREWFYAPPILPYILLMLCLIAHALIIGNYAGFLVLEGSYTFIKIIANIIVMIGISLIFYSQGKLGNRLNTVFWFQEESPDSQ